MQTDIAKMKQYETIDWKEYAQAQQQAKNHIAQKFVNLKATFEKAQSMLKQILAYSRKLEAKVTSIESEHQEAMQKLDKAKQLLLQRRSIVDVLDHENKKLRASIEKIEAESKMLAKENYIIKRELELSQQKLSFCNDINLINTPVNIAMKTTIFQTDDLDQYFVYKPLTIFDQSMSQ